MNQMQISIPCGVKPRMELLKKIQLDYRDPSLIKSLSDKEKFTLNQNEMSNNCINHGKASTIKCYKISKQDGFHIVMISDDFGFSEIKEEGQSQSKKAVCKYSEQSEYGYFNQAEKKLLNLYKENIPYYKIFRYKNWCTGFAFKKMKERGLPYAAIYELSEIEIDNLIKDYVKPVGGNEMLEEFDNVCINIIPPFMEQDPFCTKNRYHFSIYNRNIKSNTLYWENKSAISFDDYVEQLSIATGEFTFSMPINLVGGLEKTAKIKVKWRFCPNFYDSHSKLLHKSQLTRNEDVSICPSLIFSYPVLKKISGDYDRFNNPMACQEIDYRTLGIRRSITRMDKDDLKKFIHNCRKFVKFSENKIDNVNHAHPSIIFEFVIENLDNLDGVGPDSFDIIPGLFCSTKVFGKNLKDQIENESVRGILHKNKDFLDFLQFIEDILPEIKNTWQSIPQVNVDQKTCRNYKVYDFITKKEIKSTEEFSVKKTNKIFIKDSDGNFTNINKNILRFKDPSISCSVNKSKVENQNIDVISWSVPEHDLSLPVDPNNIEIRSACTLEEYEGKKHTSYEYGGPAPFHRRISLQIKHGEGWIDIGKWKEVPETGDNTPGSHKNKNKNSIKGNDIVVEENSRSNKWIWKYVPSKNRLKINPENSTGFALATDEKSEWLKDKFIDIYKKASIFAYEYNNHINSGKKILSEDFDSEELSEAYQTDFRWYLMDGAIQYHIKKDVEDYMDKYNEEQFMPDLEDKKENTKTGLTEVSSNRIDDGAKTYFVNDIIQPFNS